jgi:tRNA pseudouridine55 synthase
MNSFEEGRVILVNKPLRWTSADVVKKIRNRIHVKVGHAGTLDPLATGLLILCTGRFTKKINEFMAQEKEYTGTFTLGATTASYDLETEPDNQKDFSNIETVQLEYIARQFTGEFCRYRPYIRRLKKTDNVPMTLPARGKPFRLTEEK